MKNIRKFGILSLIIVTILSVTPSPVLASPGLSVGQYGGKGLNPEVSPGESYSWTLAVGIGDTDATTDVLIEVLGYGDNSQGDTQPLLPEDDTSSYSARSFIQPNTVTLHVEPGQTAQTNVTVTVPEDVGSGGRYAILRFSTVPKPGATVSVISVINLPMRFTIKDTQLIHQGKITETNILPTESGKPVEIDTVFQNTGNHHYKIQGTIGIMDNQNKLIDTIHVNVLSPVPDGTKTIKSKYIPQIELTPGEYSYKTKLMLEDGNLLDETNGKFVISEKYIPPSAPSSISLKPGSSGKLGTVNNLISIDFPQGAVLSEVEVSLRSYSLDQLPLAPVGYKVAMTCFRVDGLSGLLAKEATVTVKYTNADLEKAGGDAAKLKLARWDETDSKWTILDTSVDKGDKSLTTHTNRFSIWAIMVESAGSTSTDNTNTRNNTNWGLIAGMAAGIVLVAGGIYLFGFRWKKIRS
jgi:hypothetical protein